MLLTAWQQTETNFTPCVLADFNVIFCTGININNYKSHQMCTQIQSIALMFSFQEMICMQEIYFILPFQWDYYLVLGVGKSTYNKENKKLVCAHLAKTFKSKNNNNILVKIIMCCIKHFSRYSLCQHTQCVLQTQPLTSVLKHVCNTMKWMNEVLFNSLKNVKILQLILVNATVQSVWSWSAK